MALCKICNQDMIVSYYENNEVVLACGHLQSQDPEILLIERSIHESDLDIEDKVRKLGCTKEQAQIMQVRESIANTPLELIKAAFDVLNKDADTKRILDDMLSEIKR